MSAGWAGPGSRHVLLIPLRPGLCPDPGSRVPLSRRQVTRHLLLGRVAVALGPRAPLREAVPLTRAVWVFVRRKAEEDRIRKEEEKARRELIKQEYLRRKQQQILEEQGLGSQKAKPRKPRPKSVHREEPRGDSGTKCSSTRKPAGGGGWGGVGGHAGGFPGPGDWASEHRTALGRGVGGWGWPEVGGAGPFVSAAQTWRDDPRLTRAFLSLAAENLSRAQSGSSLSLASAATTEPESVHSGGTPALR